MNHFEAYLIVSSRGVDSKVLRMTIWFEYFFPRLEGKMANVGTSSGLYFTKDKNILKSDLGTIIQCFNIGLLFLSQT